MLLSYRHPQQLSARRLPQQNWQMPLKAPHSRASLRWLHAVCGCFGRLTPKHRLPWWLQRRRAPHRPTWRSPTQVAATLRRRPSWPLSVMQPSSPQPPAIGGCAITPHCLLARCPCPWPIAPHVASVSINPFPVIERKMQPKHCPEWLLTCQGCLGLW